MTSCNRTRAPEKATRTLNVHTMPMASIRRMFEPVICFGKLSRKPNENLPADVREYGITSKRVQVPGCRCLAALQEHRIWSSSSRSGWTALECVLFNTLTGTARLVESTSIVAETMTVMLVIGCCRRVILFEGSPTVHTLSLSLSDRNTLPHARIWLSGSAGPGGNHEGHTGAID